MPIRDRVSAGLGIAAVLENDANAATWGEFVFGAGKDVHSMVLMTLGTGVGGGIVADGRLVHGVHDFAGEIGHMIIHPGGHPCPCGQHGCLEQYASASAIARAAATAIHEGRKSVLAKKVLTAPNGGKKTAKGKGARTVGPAGKKTAGATGTGLDAAGMTATSAAGAAITAADVHAAYRAGDELAAELWNQAARSLAIASISLQRLLDCQMIVLAGGLTRAGEDLVSPILRHYDAMNWRMTDTPVEIAVAALGDDTGVFGAAAVAHDAFGHKGR